MCVRICPNLSLLKWFAGTKTNNIIIFGTCYSFLNDTFRLQEEQPPQSMRTLERCLHCLAKVKHLVSFFFGFSLDWKTLHVCCTVTFMKYTVWCAISLEGERYRLHRMGSIKTFFWAAELTVVYIWSFKGWDALFDAITGIKRLNYCTLWALSLNSHFFGCELRKFTFT